MIENKWIKNGDMLKWFNKHMICKHCGKKGRSLWYNGVPMKAFCWGNSKEHKEWSKVIPNKYQPYNEIKMKKTNKHKQIAKLNKIYVNTFNKLAKIVDTLPNAGKYCDCSDEFELGIFDIDVDSTNGTIIKVCLSCGGIIQH